MTRRAVPIARTALLGALVSCSEFRLRDRTDDRLPLGSGGDSAVDTATDTPDLVCATEPKPSRGTTIDEDCAGVPALGPLEISVLWQVSEWAVEPRATACMGLVVAPMVDSTGDGEITDADESNVALFSQSYGDGLPLVQAQRVLRGGDGSSVSSVLEPVATLRAVGDVDGDGRPEIVSIVNHPTVDAMAIAAFDPTAGVRLWTSDPIVTSAGLFSSRPAIGDVDGDGRAEVVVGPVWVGVDGRLVGGGSGVPPIGTGWGRPALRHAPASFPVDLDGDGLQEVVTGNVLWSHDGEMRSEGDDPDGFPAVADLDLDGFPEVLVSGNDYLRVFDADLMLSWQQHLPHTDRAEKYGEAPVVADFDGDLAPEIAIAGNTGVTLYEADGAVRWDVEMRLGGYTTPPVAYDFEGDGVTELVVTNGGHLYVLSGWDGTERWSAETAVEGSPFGDVVVADLNGDGSGEIVVAHFDLTGAYTGVTAYTASTGAFAPATSIWNQHAFSLTNVEQDGSIPADPVPSWLANNTFRSANLEPSAGLRAPDLKPVLGGVCQNECDTGLLRTWVHVCNGGLASAAGATTIHAIVRDASGDHELAVVPVDVALDVGDCTVGVPIDLPAEAARSARRVIFRLAHDVEADCQRGNEEVWLEGPQCP